MEKFNPSQALEQLGIIATLPKGANFTQQLASLNNSVAFIQKIHDDAFEKGFKAGVEASEKIDNYDKN
jgi:hypothetical protein